MARGGRTVLFVSHNLAAVRNLCTSGLVLEKGEIVGFGTADKCIALYGAQNEEARGLAWRRSQNPEKSPLAITSIDTTLTGKQPNITLNLCIELESTSQHSPSLVAIDIADSSGVVLLQTIPLMEGFLTAATREHRVDISVDLPPLIPGRYLASVWVGSHPTLTFDEVKEAVAFDIHDSPTPGRTFPHTKDHGFAVTTSRALVRKEEEK